jgi:cellulose synthase operon protein YhjQ
MTEVNPLTDPNEPPEDVATLYSWANLHGAKYRDFSAARAQTREKARLRAEQALIDEQRNQQPEAADAPIETPLETVEEPQGAEASIHEQHAADLVAEHSAYEAELAQKHAAEQDRLAAEQVAEQIAAQKQAELRAQWAAEEAERIAAQEAAEEAARAEEHAAAQHALQQAEEQAARLAEERAAELAAQQAAEAAAKQRVWQSPKPVHFEAQVVAASTSQVAPQAGIDTQTDNATAEFKPQVPSETTVEPRSWSAREEKEMAPTTSWEANESQEPSVRPAWLSNDQTETENVAAAAPPASPAAPEDTLQGSSDRLSSRWYALRGIFDGSPQPAEAAPAPIVSRAPVLGIFSLAGGVGKTSLVATLGRALSARGERVLLVDTAAFGLLPFFFGATDQRPGVLRTFNHPGVSTDALIQLVTLDPDGMSGDAAHQESLSGEIQKFSRGTSRVIIDLATASGATTRRILRMSPLVLVPVIADMNSVVSVSSIDAFFERNSNPSGKPSMPFYLLNQFDASLPLHLDVREVLREQLGERLLPFVLRRTPAMSEALAEGMTVMDYAPGSPLAEDYATLGEWVKTASAPATANYRGVRWSEQ